MLMPAENCAYQRPRCGWWRASIARCRRVVVFSLRRTDEGAGIIIDALGVISLYRLHRSVLRESSGQRLVLEDQNHESVLPRPVDVLSEKRYLAVKILRLTVVERDGENLPADHLGMIVHIECCAICSQRYASRSESRRPVGLDPVSISLCQLMPAEGHERVRDRRPRYTHEASPPRRAIDNP